MRGRTAFNIIGLAAALSVAHGCSGSRSGSAPAAPTAAGSSAALLLTLRPNPIVEDAACLCGGLPNRVSATGTLSVRETAGVALRIDSLRATLRNTTTGATTFVNDFTAADVAGHANGVNRIAAGGSLDVIDVGGHYDRGFSGAATLTIELRGTDDRNNVVTATLAVPVVRAAGI